MESRAHGERRRRGQKSQVHEHVREEKVEARNSKRVMKNSQEKNMESRVARERGNQGRNHTSKKV